jgi:hypothetical protein
MKSDDSFDFAVILSTIAKERLEDAINDLSHLGTKYGTIIVKCARPARRLSYLKGQT